MDALNRAIEHAEYGDLQGVAALAELLGVTEMCIYQWRRRGRIPAERAVEVEQAIDGAVTRHELRPDLFGASAA